MTVNAIKTEGSKKLTLFRVVPLDEAVLVDVVYGTNVLQKLKEQTLKEVLTNVLELISSITPVKTTRQATQTSNSAGDKRITLATKTMYVLFEILGTILTGTVRRIACNRNVIVLAMRILVVRHAQTTHSA